uniref:Reverse transcriptase domain-containing protein n=1 Tax=Tanacetum cinerariifolium TaxID=118510 RepID=A0A6L2K316_TANCI|nr:reverse transcriptase domain-containing protein [Tanacetum cinerariifolium]
MPPRRNKDINDFYDRIIARMDERFDQFVDRMNDTMNPRRREDRNGRRSEDKESRNPFFEGDGSSSDEQPNRQRTLFKKNRCQFMIPILKMSLRKKNDLSRKEDLMGKKTTSKTS